MAWLKLSKNFLESPAMISVISSPGGDHAFRAHMFALMWCATYNQEHMPGFNVPPGVLSDFVERWS